MEAIIIYFSRADENYFGGTKRTIEMGNTEVIARMIQKQTGADLFKIEPLHPYAVDYDTIYLGYPNYWLRNASSMVLQKNVPSMKRSPIV